MKTLFLPYFILSFASGLAQPSLFENYDGWEKVLQHSQKNQKDVLLYFGAPWCIPCKQLEKNVFVDTGVIEVMSSKYNSYYFDIDQDYSKPVMKKYLVTSVPKIIVLNSDGYLLLKAGSIPQEIGKFKELFSNISGSTSHISAVSNRMDLPYPPFYNEYFDSNFKVHPDSAIVQNYLSTQSDLFSEVNWNVMTLFNTNERYLNYLLEHREKYRSLYGSEVSFRVYDISRQLRTKYTKEKDSVRFNQLNNKLLYEPTSPKYTESLRSYYLKEIKFLADTEMDWPKFKRKVKLFTGKYGDLYNHFICSYVFESDCKDRSVYEMVSEMMVPVLVEMPYQASFVMQGKFKLKLGEKKEADEYFNRALELCKDEEGCGQLKQQIKNLKAESLRS